MEGHIADELILKLDEATLHKLVSGEWRLLLVDGHSSHFSKLFIERAIEKGWVILCYPPHCTHLLQGLDVVSFAVAKSEWTKARDDFERRTGQIITKENFLEVFSVAYSKAFTEKNNKKAFEKTGVHPFNRNAINKNDLAPSLEHSNMLQLPFKIPSPVKAIVEACREVRLAVESEAAESHSDTPSSSDELIEAIDWDSSDDEGNNSNNGTGNIGNIAEKQAAQNRSAPHQSTTSRIPPSTPFLNKLCRTIRESTPLRNAVFLSPTRTPARPPRPFYVQPTQQVLWRRLPQPAKDLQHENDMLREQLRLAERREAEHTASLEAAHSQIATMGLYTDTVHSQAVEARKKKQKGRRLRNDGWGAIITDAQAQEERARRDQEEEQKEVDKQARKDQRIEKGKEKAAEANRKKDRADCWARAQSDFKKQLAEWQEGGRIGRKPVGPKRKDVWADYDRRQEEDWVDEINI